MPLKNVILVDTGAFIALADSSDSLHKRARQVSANLEKSAETLVATPFVLMETSLYLHRRIGVDVSRRFWNSLITGDAGVEILSYEPVDLERAYEISNKYADQDFSFVDCTSFAIMERLKIPRAFSFDEDFLIVRLSAGPIHRIP